MTDHSGDDPAVDGGDPAGTGVGSAIRSISRPAWAIIGILVVALGALVVVLASGGDDASTATKSRADGKARPSTETGPNSSGTGDSGTGDSGGNTGGTSADPSSESSSTTTTTTTTTTTLPPPTTPTTDPNLPGVIAFTVPDSVQCANSSGSVEITVRLELVRSVEWVLQSSVTSTSHSFSGGSYLGLEKIKVGCATPASEVKLVVGGTNAQSVTQTRTVTVRYTAVSG